MTRMEWVGGRRPLGFVLFLWTAAFFVRSSQQHEAITPPNAAARLLANETDELILMFMGDPQYHFPCTLSNAPCKEASAVFRETNKLNKMCERVDRKGLASLQVKDLEEQCAIMEGNFSNEIQRKAIFDLYRRMANKPKGLIVNGDLTNFGHTHQLALFKTEWLTMPFPLFVGLGNHDIENNVNDCVANQCVNNMLSWFTTEYAPLMNLTLDMETQFELWKSVREGSFAYFKDFCSDSDANCVHSIQLHNRADYATSVNSVSSWRIRSSLQWLRHDLDQMRNRTWPVLINLHNYEAGTSGQRLKRELTGWLANDENLGIIRKPFVLFAHYHEKHSMTVECISGTTVPFLYVGSVPRNRYTVIKFKERGAEIFFMNANADGTNTVVGIREFTWRPC
ncbi:hypothetical protein M3Y99_01296800 [Aphelenchoides fujianensis]|nr:hypothetical protein M3Y99_01296800 [Aphelenchoides fujianensis]